MKITLNDQPLMLPESISLAQLLTCQQIFLEGTSIAVNNHIIPKANWQTTLVQAADQISVFQVIAGG